MILTDLVPLKRRGTYQGYLNIVFATGMSLGAPLGGLAADIIGWRWSFGIQIPIIIASTLTVSIKIPETVNIIESSQCSRLKRIDFGGAVALVRHIIDSVDNFRFCV